MNRYEAALAYIAAIDKWRMVRYCGVNTVVDFIHLEETRYRYNLETRKAWRMDGARSMRN